MAYQIVCEADQSKILPETTRIGREEQEWLLAPNTDLNSGFEKCIVGHLVILSDVSPSESINMDPVMS